MSSTMNAILEAVASELGQFGFATVKIGAFHDAAYGLPACLVVPVAEKAMPHGPLREKAQYVVELRMQFAARGQDALLETALQGAENVTKHFAHRLFPSLAGHVDTVAEAADLTGADRNGSRDLARPTVTLALATLTQA